eukprot:TRINITY_DN6086_c0_g1_i2.p1 TRINITY_DN6086_c0_g1~~TRINITY_DN6086_c0_g1_i2.p1  ORF type:complete len:248 (-),score=20.60 TRINITY_DN6086_c0_g1_i2:475-1218(-)
MLKKVLLRLNSVSLISGGNVSHVKDTIFLSSLRKVAVQLHPGVHVEEFYTDSEKWAHLRAFPALHKQLAGFGYDPKLVAPQHLHRQWSKAEILASLEHQASEGPVAVIMNSHGNSQGFILRTGPTVEIITPTELFEAVKMAQHALVVVDSCNGTLWLEKQLAYPNICLICTNGRAYGWGNRNSPDVILGSILIDLVLECGPINDSFADRLRAAYAIIHSQVSLPFSCRSLACSVCHHSFADRLRAAY